MDKTSLPTIETIKIVKCTTGYIVYLYDVHGDRVATKAITQLGGDSYWSTDDSVLGAIKEAFLIKGEM